MITLIGIRCKHSNVCSQDILIARFLLGNLKMTVVKNSIVCIILLLEMKLCLVLCFGGLTQGSHLISFRTQKLSLVVAMILRWRGK